MPFFRRASSPGGPRERKDPRKHASGMDSVFELDSSDFDIGLSSHATTSVRSECSPEAGQMSRLLAPTPPNRPEWDPTDNLRPVKTYSTVAGKMNVRRTKLNPKPPSFSQLEPTETQPKFDSGYDCCMSFSNPPAQKWYPHLSLALELNSGRMHVQR